VQIVKHATGVLNFFVAMVLESVSDVLFNRIELIIIQTFVRHDLENRGIFGVLNDVCEL
jgi:hypothetical protein